MTTELQKWIDRLQEASGDIPSRIKGHYIGGRECDELRVLLTHVKEYIETHHLSETEVIHGDEEKL